MFYILCGLNHMSILNRVWRNIYFGQSNARVGVSIHLVHHNFDSHQKVRIIEEV